MRYLRAAHPWLCRCRAISREGSLGRAWQISKPAAYAAIARLERLGLVQMAGEQPTSQGPARSLVKATRAGRTAARGWLHTPVVHGRDVRSELMIKLALLERAGRWLPGECVGGGEPAAELVVDVTDCGDSDAVSEQRVELGRRP